MSVGWTIYAIGVVLVAISVLLNGGPLGGAVLVLGIGAIVAALVRGLIKLGY